MKTVDKKLFSPINLGARPVRNRIVLPPLTRSRATEDGIPTDLMTVYYEQRAGAGLVVSEGTVISDQATAYPRVPGLYNENQVEAWRPITAALHRHGAVVFAQLWHVGRQSHSARQPDNLPPYAPSPVPITGFSYRGPEGKVPYETPRELSVEQINEIVAQYAAAAIRALDAGFDGVELHAANGYLIDQFLNSSSNKRTDEYGGSLQNRLRFLSEVVEAVSSAISAEKVGVRFSPSSTWMDVFDDDKKGLFAAAISSISGKGLAYLHLVEPEIAGSSTIEASADSVPSAYFSELFDGPVIVTGGHTADSAELLLSTGAADMVGFGRLFMANPDLPDRFVHGAELLEIDESSGRYDANESGYVDYPSLRDEELWSGLREKIAADEEFARGMFDQLRQQSTLELHQDGKYYVYSQLAHLYE
ncbi:N-ethylmaleimide reductase [Paenarthrobacter nicotinovorans]|uniref:alkene reductase n=1 Tax=Paenarthrobacter nicotinovorans TaxID=29320 RepID=UPI002785CA73|nr:alkene reductase [Paenarthrobacter nicotinovorans]MDP9933767.1 N-ethylmaleimide reductase [Paenarthrobacter nicotinovorans]